MFRTVSNSLHLNAGAKVQKNALADPDGGGGLLRIRCPIFSISCSLQKKMAKSNRLDTSPQSDLRSFTLESKKYRSANVKWPR